MAKWIRFEQRHLPSRKPGKTSHLASPGTAIWEVIATEGGVELGVVTWYGAWRKYVYAPYQGSVYEQDRLRDIANFCEKATREHRQHLAEGKIIAMATTSDRAGDPDGGGGE